jgi:hypothetical protein
MELRDVGISWVMFFSRARQICGRAAFHDNFMADISRYVGMAPNWGENLVKSNIYFCILISSNQHGGQKT